MSPKIFSPEEKDAREQEMLDCARDIIKADGEVGLTIDKLVKNLPYSKGTVYNHFTSKEDILMALCHRHMTQMAELYVRALSFEGSSREKALAVHVGSLLQAKANPDDFMMAITVKTAGCHDKASDKRMQAHQHIEGQILTPIFNLFRTAYENNELTLPEGMAVEQLAFSSWSIDFGTQILLMGENRGCGLRTQLVVERELINSINLLHDGMRWKPLAQDYDWKASIQRMKTEVFAKEMAIIEAAGIEMTV